MGKLNIKISQLESLYCIILLGLILYTPLISAKPEIQVISSGGLTVEYPQIDFLKQYSPFTFHTHVNNLTAIQTNKTTSCLIHVYNSSGRHIIEGYYEWDSNEYEFKYNASGDLFHEKGIHPYIIICNSTGKETGGVAGSFEVTPLGIELTDSQTKMYIFIFIIFFILFFACLIGGIYLPSNNQSDEMTGYIIAVSNMKYVKVFLLAFAFLAMLFLSYFSWQLSLAYTQMEFISRIFFFLFYFSIIIVLIGFPLMIYFLIANWIRDNKISEALSRGLHVKES